MTFGQLYVTTSDEASEAVTWQSGGFCFSQQKNLPYTLLAGFVPSAGGSISLMFGLY